MWAVTWTFSRMSQKRIPLPADVTTAHLIICFLLSMMMRIKVRRWQGGVAGRRSKGNELANRLVGSQTGSQTGLLERREQTSVRLQYTRRN